MKGRGGRKVSYIRLLVSELLCQQRVYYQQRRDKLKLSRVNELELSRRNQKRARVE